MGDPKAEDALYDKERDEAHNTINKNQEEYDKQLLTLGVGFLALSETFIKDVVNLNVAVWRPMLYASWILLTLCIIVVLFSYQASIAGHFKAKKYWENRKNQTQSKFPYGTAKFVRGLNIFSGILFVVGIACCTTFVLLNVTRGGTVPEHNDNRMIKPALPGDVQRGSHLKEPPRAPATQPTQTPAQPSQQQSGGSNDGQP